MSEAEEAEKMGRRSYIKYVGAAAAVVAAGAAGYAIYEYTKPPPAPEEIEWGVWSWGVELVQENTGIFNDNNPDAKINVTDLGADYVTNLYARYAADDPPDIFYATPDVAYVVQYKEWAADMEDYAPEARKYLDEMYPGVREFYINPFTDKVHGLCYWLGPYVLGYNERHLKEAGFDAPPKTYDELASQALAIKKAGIVEYPIGALWSWGFPAMWYNIMIGMHRPENGKRYLFDEDLDPIFHNKDSEFFEAVKWFLDRVHVDKTISPGIREYDESGITIALGSGSVSFALAFADYDVAGANVAEMKETGNIKMALNPGSGYAVYHPTNYSVSTHCMNRGKSAQEAAWRVMEYVGGKTTDAKSDFAGGKFFVCNRLIQQYGVTSAYRAVMEDPANIAKLQEFKMNVDVLLEQYEKLSTVLWRDPVQTPWWGDWFSSPSSEVGGRVKPKFEDIMTGVRGHSDTDILTFLQEIADDWSKSKKAAGM
ncbi:MAG: ABC transporter substrate-binding protein [Nitrososphaeria archaeon]